MPVNESASLEQALTDDVGTSVDRVYLNGLYPERFSAEEMPAIERAAEATPTARYARPAAPRSASSAARPGSASSSSAWRSWWRRP